MSSQTGVKSIDWANTLPGQQVEPVQGRLVDVPACSLLVVTAGQLCLFCQRLEEGTPQGSPTQLAPAEPGELMFMPRDTDSIRFWVRSISNTEVIRMGLDEVRATGCPKELALELRNFTERLVSDELRFWMRANSETDEVVVSGQDVSGSTRALAFTSATDALIAGFAAPPGNVGAADELESLGLDLSTCIERSAQEQIDHDYLRFSERVKKAQALNAGTLTQSLTGISSNMRLVDSSRMTQLGSDPFDSACRLVAAQMGIKLDGDTGGHFATRRAPIDVFCQAARLKHRVVLLDSDWWHHNGGHMVAVHEPTSNPVALIRTRAGYDAHVFDRNGGVKIIKVDRKFALELNPHAEMLYPSLPSGRIGFRDIARLAFRGARGDLIMMFLATLVLAVFNATTPVILAWIVSWVIPMVQVSAIFYFGALLLLAAIGSALVHVVSGYAFLRIETRSSFYVLAAFVDRVLRLPASFFRNTSSGDLSQRIMAIEQIRSRITQSVVSVVISFMSGFAYVLLMFYYDFNLGLVGLGLVVLLLIALLVFGVLLARAEFAVAVAKGGLDGAALDIFSGIRQVRIQGSFSRVLARSPSQAVSDRYPSYI